MMDKAQGALAFDVIKKAVVKATSLEVSYWFHGQCAGAA